MDLTGQRFGRLTVSCRGENSRTGKVQWFCKCECGQTILAIANNLRREFTTSCGCKKSDPNPVTHQPNGISVLVLESRDGSKFDCLIDTTDYDLVKQYRWYAARNKEKRTFYAVHSYVDSTGHHGLRMHRLLSPGVKSVDHKDHNGLNNRKNNLRSATGTGQIANRPKVRGVFTSQYRGVWRTKWGKWGAGIGVNYQRVRLGYFSSEEDAARAYDVAARQFHGDFACVNFPRKHERSALESKIA